MNWVKTLWICPKCISSHGTSKLSPTNHDRKGLFRSLHSISSIQSHNISLPKISKSQAKLDKLDKIYKSSPDFDISYTNHKVRQRNSSRKLPNFGLRLIDYMGVEKLDPPLLRITNPKSPTFDLYNNRFVVQNITQPPDLKLPEKSTAQKSQNERVARVWTNSLERLTILALRLTHLREGKSTVERFAPLLKFFF